MEIVLAGGRGFGGDERLISQKDSEAWERIGVHFSKFEVANKRAAFQYEIDWSSVIEYRRREMDFYNQSRKKSFKSFEGFTFEHSHKCPIIATPLVKSDREVDAVDLLHWKLLEIFLISNLACPGSFSLHGSRIVNNNASRPWNVETDLEVSHYYPETAWHEANGSPWLKVGFIPFDTVLEWHQRLNISGKFMASSGIERALFSLLHLGRSRGDFDPGDIMWLASAIESLYGITPSGGAGSILPTRITALLEVGGDEGSDLKKRLKAFFDLRHKFAHGGGRILHPLAIREDGDEGVQASIEAYLEATNFAAGILVGSIQELIRRGWTGMAFKEALLPTT